MVDCAEFLDRYSEFRDRGLDAEAHARFDEHRRSCLSCARYDRVMMRGVGMLHELPEVKPSPDFMPRLQHRLFHLDDERALRRAGRGAGTPLATLAIAGAIAAAAWTPWLRVQVASPPTVASADADTVAPFAEPVRAASAWIWEPQPVAIHGPIAPAMAGSGAELLLWSPTWGSSMPVQTAFLGAPGEP